jgi:urease accessory protein
MRENPGVMTPQQLVATLQIADSFFPVGAFAYSDGLEHAAAAELVHDGGSLEQWMQHYMDSVFIPCEGLALFQCMDAWDRGDVDAIHRIDQELTALKPAAPVRASSSSIGRRLLAAHTTLNSGGDASLPALPQGNSAVAYGLVFARRGLHPRNALLAYGYGRLAGIVSAALRLLPIGQQRGQEALTKVLQSLPEAAETILAMAGEPLRSFNPRLDIQQMNHRHLYSRLFRS